MKRYPLLSIMLFALAFGLLLSGASMAGEKCCKPGDGATCAPCPSKGTSASATSASAQCYSSSATVSSPTASNMRSNHSQMNATLASQNCEGKSCVPCKPGQMCDGKPCKPGDCKSAGGKCTSESKSSI